MATVAGGGTGTRAVLNGGKIPWASLTHGIPKNMDKIITETQNPLLNAPKPVKVLTPEQKKFRDEIVDWLDGYPWTKTWTVTFDRMEERKQQNYTQRNGYVQGHGWTGGGRFKGKPQKIGISERNAKRYFERYMEKDNKDVSWFYCVEPNPSRSGHHLHALLCPGTGQKLSHKVLGEWWWARYGWNKVEDIRSKKDISGYCTKHIVRYLNKGGGWYNLQINDTDIFHGRRKAVVMSE